MTWKIEITEPHSGELGEAIEHADHSFAMEEYSYEQGRVLAVHVHRAEEGAEWHIFTDLDELYPVPEIHELATANWQQRRPRLERSASSTMGAQVARRALTVSDAVCAAGRGGCTPGCSSLSEGNGLVGCHRGSATTDARGR